MNHILLLSAAQTTGLSFQPENFLHNLRHMGTGMAVIFLIIGAIILSTMLINYLFSDSKES